MVQEASLIEWPNLQDGALLKVLQYYSLYIGGRLNCEIKEFDKKESLEMISQKIQDQFFLAWYPLNGQILWLGFLKSPACRPCSCPYLYLYFSCLYSMANICFEDPVQIYRQFQLQFVFGILVLWIWPLGFSYCILVLDFEGRSAGVAVERDLWAVLDLSEGSFGLLFILCAVWNMEIPGRHCWWGRTITTMGEGCGAAAA